MTDPINIRVISGPIAFRVDGVDYEYTAALEHAHEVYRGALDDIRAQTAKANNAYKQALREHGKVIKQC